MNFVANKANVEVVRRDTLHRIDQHSVSGMDGLDIAYGLIMAVRDQLEDAFTPGESKYDSAMQKLITALLTGKFD